MEILKKHSALISMTNKELSITQRKSLNVLYLCAKKNLEKGQGLGKWHNIEVNSMRKLLGIQKGNTNHLKDELIKMTKIGVEYNFFKKDKVSEWGYFGLLSNELNITYNENGTGIIHYKLSEKIEENLLIPNIFAKVDLELIKELKSKYAVPFYELLEDYKNVNIPRMTIEEFKEFLGIETDKYKLFGDFKKKVIEVIKAEINEKTSFTIDYELTKQAQKITGIQWRIVEYNNEKQNLYFEKIEFIEKCRNEYKQGEIMLDDRGNGVYLLMGKGGLLAKKSKIKDKPETVKKDLAFKAWDWLFKNQIQMEKPRGMFRI